MSSVNIDFATYAADKATGTVELVKAGGVVHVAVPQFDAKTGKALNPQLVPLDVESLKNAQKYFEASAAGVGSLIADIEKLVEAQPASQ